MNTISKLQNFDDPTFNPFAADDAGFGDLADIHGRIAALRAQGTVHKGDIFSLLGLSPDMTLAGPPHYTVVGHKQIADVFGDPAAFSNDILKANAGVTFGEILSTMNPPVHTRYRRVFQQAFLPHIINK